MKLLLSLFLLFITTVNAEVKTERLSPNSVDQRTQTIGGDHLILSDDSVASNGHLLINLGGTHSSPADYKGFNHTAAESGYQVLALDYPNKVITTSCRKAAELDCFERFRQEIALGVAGSEFVEVERENSIEFRIESTIKKRAQNDPKFKRYLLPNGEVDWSKVVLAGHSQGSGHAAFMAKKHAVKGVIMIAGPQDTTDEMKLAPWLFEKGATAPKNYYSLIHDKDFFGSAGQIEASRALLSDLQAPVIAAQEAHCQTKAPGNIYVSHTPVRDPHNDVARNGDFKQIWAYLLNQSAGY